MRVWLWLLGNTVAFGLLTGVLYRSLLRYITSGLLVLMLVTAGLALGGGAAWLAGLRTAGALLGHWLVWGFGGLVIADLVVDAGLDTLKAWFWHIAFVMPGALLGAGLAAYLHHRGGGGA